MKNKERKFAVVTGASSGIGFEIARVLADHDYDLLMIAENADIAESASALGLRGDVQPLRADLSQSAGVEQVAQRIRQIGRPIDALVLNAGVGVCGDFIHNKLEDEINLVNLNVLSVVHLSRLLLPEMVERKSGRVMITSSIAALMPGPFYATYAASKSFLLSFSEALFNELKDSGVTVTALMPGATDTNFFARAHMLETAVGNGPKDDPAIVAQQAYDAMIKGENHVIGGGLKNKIQGFFSHFMTDQRKAQIQRKQTEPREHSSSAPKSNSHR